MGVIVRIIFSLTPDEAMSVGLVKACVRRNKSILFIEKSSALLTFIYDDIGVLVLKRVVVVERGLLHIHLLLNS